MKKPNDETTKLYDEIYKNAAMGAGTTGHLLDGKRGEKMNQTLQKQYAEYLSVCRSAKEGCARRGREIKGLSRFEKMRTDGGVSLNLLFDRSDGNVAKMMMNGGTMGVINAGKMLSKYKNADPEAQALMRHLSDFELQTVEVMRDFL